MSDRVVILKDAAELATRAAALILEKIAPGSSVMLAGGSTPRAVYEQLVAIEPREKTRKLLASARFYFGDERCVPPEDPESNFNMARAALAGAGKLEIVRIEAERADRAGAARDYAKLLPAEVSVLILGIGEDGHTASLFPASPSLDVRSERVIAVDDSPKPPKERITITPPVIDQARSVFMLVTGSKKAEAVARALEGPLDPKKTPAQLARRGTWILDREAAALLKKTRNRG